MPQKGISVQEICKRRVEEALRSWDVIREGKWTESIAVDSKPFVVGTKEKLGSQGKGGEVVGEDGCYQLREPFVAYMGNLGGENEPLSFENTYFWKDI